MSSFQRSVSILLLCVYKLLKSCLQTLVTIPIAISIFYSDFTCLLLSTTSLRITVLKMILLLYLLINVKINAAFTKSLNNKRWSLDLSKMLKSIPCMVLQYPQQPICNYCKQFRSWSQAKWPSTYIEPFHNHAKQQVISVQEVLYALAISKGVRNARNWNKPYSS